MADVTGELTVGGRTRGFALRLPRGASGGMPLVIVLHGNHPDATGQICATDHLRRAGGRVRLRRRLPRRCWRLLGRRPRRHHGRRGGRGNVAFLRALVDTSAERHGTHPDRAVVAGVSNGAFMAHRMALEASERWRAPPSAGCRRVRDPRPAHAVSAMLIHGTADPVSPIEGGYSRHRGPDGNRAAGRPGQDGRVLARRRPLRVRSRRYAHHRVLDPDHGRGGVGETRVTAWTVFGGGHLARRQAVSRDRRAGFAEFDAAEEICRFAGPLLAAADSRRL